ncbi:hypothetical protein BDN72DRAFT_910534, partial [Pluteus cervinus]
SLLSSNRFSLTPFRLKDNLRPDKQYITSWLSAGWTNDVMTYANLIYLAVLTERIPIIPPFIPSHIGGHVPPIPFGEVFDVPRISKALEMPILEFRHVKDPNSTFVDELGCWNTWEAVEVHHQEPRPSPHLDLLKLDISYTTAPTWIKAAPQFENDVHTSFWGLASLSYPELRTMALTPPAESRLNKVMLPPDEHLLCYDYLYYVCAFTPFDFKYDFSPAWRYVARYMYFTPRLLALADEYVRRAMGVSGGEATPPFVSVHIRHADFSTYCGELPKDDCFAPISVIARRVREVQDEMWEKKGIQINHVMVTSDERNETWWQEIYAQGWLSPDHSRTKELYGEWYPVLIDAVIQATGAGFVGTDGSTMSMIAKRRTETWSDGASRIYKWGYPGADDH